MLNLILKTNSSTRKLLSAPFSNVPEEKLEEVVFNTPEILEDIIQIKRQIICAAGKIDILGIDKDDNICIVEIKNETVDVNIIPQVLKYAIWAEQNPDSIKSLWLELENKPEDREIDWDHPQIRIIVIAPDILRSTLGFIDKIGYQIDLVEIVRWFDDDKHILLVNELEEEIKPKPSTVKGRPNEYNKEFYEGLYNKKSVTEFYRYISETEKIIKDRKWSLETKFNKYYVGFKAGFFNAFGIKWIGSKTFAFFFKLEQKDVKSLSIEMTRYENQWKEAVYYIDPGKTEVNDFIPLFELAYRRLTGDSEA